MQNVNPVFSQAMENILRIQPAAPAKPIGRRANPDYQMRRIAVDMDVVAELLGVMDEISSTSRRLDELTRKARSLQRQLFLDGNKV